MGALQQAMLAVGAGGGPTDFDETNLFSRIRAEGLTDSGSPFSDTDPIPNCDDISGNGNDWGQVNVGERPVFRTNQVNSKAAIQFTSASNQSFGGPFFTALSEAEFFVVVKVNADPAASGGSSGSWRLNLATGLNDAATYPFTDGVIYESAFIDTSSESRVSVNPTPSLSAAYRLYGVQAKSGSNNYLIRLDGTTIATATRSPIFNWQSAIGRSQGSSGINFMSGFIAEWFVLSAAAGTPQRESIRDYINSFYGLSTV